MELIQRILRIFRANLHSFMTSAEDPEKILQGVLMEMQDNLVELRQAVAQAIATQKRTERQAATAQSHAEEWYRRAQLALQQNQEPLAREALTKRRAHQEMATALLTQIEQQNTVVTKLKKDMRALELKIAEAKAKKDMFIARARSAEASFQLHQTLNGFTNNDSLQAFERMEEKVLQLEAQAEAVDTLNNDPLESSFASLEASESVNAEITAMKLQLAAASSNTPQASSQTGVSSTHTGEISGTKLPPQQQPPQELDS